jgi:hypothetical protein
MTPDPLPSRLKAATPGLGQASQTDVERRAKELAATDGRADFTETDLQKAAQELDG